MLSPATTESVALNREQRRALEKKQRRQPTSRPRARFATNAEAYAHLLKPIALLDACRPYAESELAHDLLRIMACYERLKDGTADEEDFNRVAVAINLAKVRALEIDQTLADELEKAQDAMMASKERRLKRGRFGFDGPGLQAMEYAIEAHEAIVTASSPKQMENAMGVVRDVLVKQTNATKCVRLALENVQ